MKNLNRFIPAFFLFLAMAFMVSCSQDEALESLENTVDQAVAKQMILPLGYAQKGDAEIQAYMDNLDDEAYAQLFEHTRVGYYLESIGLREKVEAGMQEGDLYHDLDLTQVLTEKQVKELKQFTSNQFTSATRPCGSWHYSGTEYRCIKWGYITLPYGGGTYYGCKQYGYTCVYWRSCSNWPYKQYKYGCGAV